MDEGRLNDLVLVARAPPLLHETTGAMELLRAEITGAVYGGDIEAFEDSIWFDLPAPLQFMEKIPEDRCETFRSNSVQHLPHAGLLRHRRDAEERLEIARLLHLLHPLLELQQRGVLEEHHGKARQDDVVDLMGDLALLAPLGNLGCMG